MNNLALMLALSVIAVFAEKLPESTSEGGSVPQASVEPETGTTYNPENSTSEGVSESQTSVDPNTGTPSEPENSALIVHGYVLTIFVSFLVCVLLK